mmetsp:Transcript_7310/g.8007  ORF Transcript_7310/g.8007 Transcript_7310/m.8007 type:complete len:285 (-) Transcript_7310:245-1099(-)
MVDIGINTANFCKNLEYVLTVGKHYGQQGLEYGQQGLEQGLQYSQQGLQQGYQKLQEVDVSAVKNIDWDGIVQKIDPRNHFASVDVKKQLFAADQYRKIISKQISDAGYDPEQLIFMVLGGIFIAFALFWTCCYFFTTKRGESSSEAGKKQKGKKTKKPRLIPRGKIAICRYCNTYLEEPMLENHTNGKRHISAEVEYAKTFSSPLYNENKGETWYKFEDIARYEAHKASSETKKQEESEQRERAAKKIAEADLRNQHSYIENTGGDWHVVGNPKPKQKKKNKN